MFLMRRAYGGESEIDHNPLRQNEHDRIAVFVDGETSIFQTKAKPLPNQNWTKKNSNVNENENNFGWNQFCRLQ